MAVPRIELIYDACVAPLTKIVLANGSSGGSFDGGVYDAHGNVVASGLQIKSGYLNLPAPLDRPASRQIREPCVFAGMLQNEHFGHFMIESVARLWAAKHLADTYRSFVFYSRVPGHRVPSFATELLDLLGLRLDVLIADEVLGFSSLAIPTAMVAQDSGVLFGHQVIRDLFGAIPRAYTQWPEKVYVSRSKLDLRDGGLLLESRIERLMEMEGYFIFHPQEYSMQDQADIYRAAKAIVFADGSAFHYYVPFSRKEQKVFVIWRRRMNHLFSWQAKTFDGPTILGKPCLSAIYGTELDRHRQLVGARGLVDFPALHAQLHSGEFVGTASWGNAPKAEIEVELARLAQIKAAPILDLKVDL